MSKPPVVPATPTLNAAPPPARRAFALPKRSPPAAGPVSGEDKPAGQQQQIEVMALAAVRLAALGPQLAALAVRMEEQADAQAHQAERIAGATRELTERLGILIGGLQAASGNVHEAMGEIARIADQTRILSINASIEAARAGEHGRTFSIVAREVQQLADQTRSSTDLIEARVQAIQGSVSEVAASVAPSPAGSGGTQSAAPTLQSVNRDVQVMAGTAEKQQAGARSLRSFGDQANRLTEELLLAVGTFRLAAHRRAEEDVRAMLADLAPVAGDARHLEELLQSSLHQHPDFDLLYVTDPHGRQISANVGWKDGGVWSDATALGRDWRERAWFRDALRHPDRPVATDIYRSAATGEYCFTISGVICDAGGRPLGVLGADVNFLKLLATDTRTGPGDSALA
ncbi:MAG TPA: methyl-accepting chemotaxis protein [Lacunisphaera sp.]|nr:methyl-accepting chemotaxis protein [Lacunisphaera sp.]